MPGCSADRAIARVLVLAAAGICMAAAAQPDGTCCAAEDSGHAAGAALPNPQATIELFAAMDSGGVHRIGAG
jgi:hypothetical protein